MKLTEFESVERYIEVQRRTDGRKSRRSSAKKREIRRIADWIKQQEGSRVRFGICHGARYGMEVDWFKLRFRRAEIIGTDLFLKGHPGVIEWDFHEVKPEWIGKADFVYSNSLDHSYDPMVCLTTWLGQLKDEGHLFVLWHPCQINVRRGDCFGAHLHEYVALMNEAGRVVDVIYHGGLLFTLVATNK